MKRLLSLALALLMLAGAVACTPTPSVADVTSDDKGEAVIQLSADGVSEYVVVRSDVELSDSYEVKGAVALRNALKEHVPSIGITTDWVKRGEPMPEDTKEILVGSTNRPETEAARALIGEDQYIIKVIGKRIVLLGGSKIGTLEAVDRFIELFVGQGRTISIPEAFEEIVTITYEEEIDYSTMEMLLYDPTGPVNDNEFWGFKNYITHTLARPTGNLGNQIVYGAQGQATEAMGMVYEISGDVEVLDIMIEFCDKMIYTRNDMPGGDGRIMWTGKVEPAWPNKEKTADNAGYASSENGDIVGHILYCVYLILRDPTIHSYMAPTSEILENVGETYYDRAMYYLSMMEPTLDYFTTHFIQEGTMQQRFPTSDAWKVVSRDAGGCFPCNQQMMFNNGFVRAMQVYALLGQTEKAAYYESIVRASVNLMKADWKLKTEDGNEYYHWFYELPNGRHPEDYGHGAFTNQGYYRIYQTGVFSDILTETDMIRLANGLRYYYYDETRDVFLHSPGNDKQYGQAYIGFCLMSLYSDLSRELVYKKNLESAKRMSTDVGLFGHMLYIKYKEFGSALEKSSVPVTTKEKK